MEVVANSDAGPPEKPVNPILLIHSLLRGRYRLALVLAVLGAAIGGLLGFFVLKPEYRSTGVVEIRATLPTLLYQTPENQAIPDFGPFLMTQVELLRSSRIVGLAMQDPKWRALGRGLLPEQVLKFNKSLEIDSPRNSQLIRVQFTDADPKAAATAVEAVIRAYEKVFVDKEINAGAPMIEALDRIRLQQRADVKSIRDRIQGIAGKDDPDALQQIYESFLTSWLEAAQALNRAEAEVSPSGGPQADPASQPVAPTTQPFDAIVQEVMDRDPRLQQLQEQRIAADREWKGYRFRYGEKHALVAQAQNQLEIIDEDIEARKGALTEMVRRASTQPSVLHGDGGIAAVANPRERVIRLRALRDSLRSEWDAVAEKQRQIQNLSDELKLAQDVLDATNKRIVQLRVENSKNSERLSVLSYGEVPLEPEKDRRRALTAVGAIGGAGLGVAIVALMGFFDPRLRHVDSTRSRLKPIDRLLGVLPELPDGSIRGAASSAAAFCVHHIRAMLQIRQRATGHKLIGVTSPSPGDGKTTLVVSLGMSLAATGARTVMVDCDFDGAGLSARMRRLIDQHPAGHDPGRGPTTKPIGNRGLAAALNGASLDTVVVPTGYPQLSLLPLGVEAGASVGQLAPQTLSRVFARLAESFDTILVDTGPILGSVEASIVAAEVDSMILVVSRNGDRIAADQALEKLAAAGAEVEGLIFNRALDSDVERSAYRTSTSTRSQPRGPSARHLHTDTAAPAAGK